MKYLDKVLEINEIDGQHREAASKEYLEAKETVKELPISLGADAQMMLSNHLMALIKRISLGQFVDPVEEEMMSEVSEKAWEYAGKIVNPLFEAHGIPVDKSELFLVGTHMEMAIASAEAVQ